MSEISPLSDDIGFLLARAGAITLNTASKALAPFGLRVRTYSALLLACESADGVNQRRIAEVMGLDPSQIVALVDELETLGLIVREVDPLDRRHKLTVPTTDGLALCLSAHDAVRESHAHEFAVFGPGATEVLRKALTVLVFSDADGRA